MLILLYHKAKYLYTMAYYNKKQNKYGAVKQTFNGRSYHSKKEAAYAQDLYLLQKAGEIKEIIPQFKLELNVNGLHICNYYMDFVTIDNEDVQTLHEVKGFETPLWRLKWKLTQALLEAGEIPRIKKDAKLLLIK